MTTSQDPEQLEETAPETVEQAAEQTFLPDRPERQPRPRRQRAEQNPALDPRLVQLERRARPTRVSDISLLFIGIAAFVFGVAMHGWVAMAVLDDDGPAESSNQPVAATATPDDAGGADATPTAGPRPTETPLPDRTSCDEIRGTQYRSVTERDFFLANCTSG